MAWRIPLFRIDWDEGDVRAVDDVIRSGMNWANGAQVTQFERETAAYIGTRCCLTFNSGTSALHAALAALRIGPGDEAIVPSFTFIATANAPQFVGARPVFADIEEGTLGLDPDDVMERITAKTKAIIPVHYGGCPCRVVELAEIAEDHHLHLIEDAAEAFGARIGDRRVGTFGTCGVMSYCQNKVIATGEGGAVVTESRDLYERMKLIQSHGRLETANYFETTLPMDYVGLGYNFRMSSITAALGLSQLRKVDAIISKRREKANAYHDLLRQNVPGCRIFEPPEGYFHVYQLLSIRTGSRERIMKALEEAGIMTKVYFPPVHLSHFYHEVLNYRCHLPVTERVAEEIVSLPFHPELPLEQVEEIVARIADVPP